MNWNHLTSGDQLDQIDRESHIQAVLIYKHSTRCHVCTQVKRNVEAGWNETYDTSLKPYFLDVLVHRDVSNAVAERYKVPHESPQSLVIVKGNCVHNASHADIRLNELLDKAAAV